MFGYRLKSLRNNISKTQEEMATYLGITRGAYSHFETERNEPDYETLKKLSEYFQVSTDYLLGRTDDPTPIRDVDQDLYDGHNYGDELEAFLKDHEMAAMFMTYQNWSEEEKRNLLNILKGQEMLREKNKEK